MLPVRFVIPIEQMQGEVPEKAEMLRSMAAEATKFISSFANGAQRPQAERLG
jgi:hypothetical protein